MSEDTFDSQVNVRVTKGLLERAKRVSKKAKVPVSAVLREALWLWAWQKWDPFAMPCEEDEPPEGADSA